MKYLNMTNRKKRLSKGIDSLEEQIKVHKEKHKKAINNKKQSNNIE